MPISRPHACRSMHTSQVVFGREPGFQRSSTYSGEFVDKYTQPVSNLAFIICCVFNSRIVDVRLTCV